MKDSTRRITLTALLSAVALVLSFIESLFVFVPQFPGIKVGLSNVAVMFALFGLSKKTAFSICIIKGIFALLTRGAMAGVLSLTGGVASLIVIIVIFTISKNATLSLISIFGALTHNLSQFAVVSVVYSPASILPYLPLLIVSAVIFGTVNALFLKAVSPHLNQVLKVKK